jgi:hypothetical protein
VDKGHLLVWMGSGQQRRVSAILNSGSWGYIGVTGSFLLRFQPVDYTKKDLSLLNIADKNKEAGQ